MINRIKTDEEIQAMREGGRMLASVLQSVKSAAKPGMTTKDLADLAAQEVRQLGAKPAFLGYYGFPDVLCVSLNDEIVHGIPSPHRFIRDGDIVSCDFGVLHKNLITDAAISFIVGTPLNKNDERLVAKTKESLEAGIAAIRSGVKTGEVGAAIQSTLLKERLGIVRDFVGHGVGHELHEEPNIPNYGSKNEGTVLKAGMTVAVEPMATLGGEGVFIERDGWTARTNDRSRSAHFEHTILVTIDGYEILTEVKNK